MPNFINAIMGNLVRRQRQGLGLSQAQLAEKLGVSTETIVDAELGVARLSGPLLVHLAELRPERGSPPAAKATSEGECGLLVRLIDSFSSIRSPTVRKALLALLPAETTIVGPQAGENSWG